MSSSTQSPPAGAVAESPVAPYTGPVAGARAAAPVPWWKDAVRSWVPVLGFAILLVFQMVSLQQQIGDLRDDIRTEIGSLRVDHQKEFGNLRTEIGNLRVDLGERITRLEILMEARAGASASRPGD